jgi:hypothetical protein
MSKQASIMSYLTSSKANATSASNSNSNCANQNNNSNNSVNVNNAPLANFKALNAANNSIITIPSKCIYCQNSLGTVSIKCAECSNFYLCLKVKIRF